MITNQDQEIAIAKVPKLKWEPLHEQTYRELRSAIMTARFAPGEKLSVRTVAAAFGVSPMPVRAAFSRLVAERALVQNANGMINVPNISADTLEEIISFRVLLEGIATERAATKITKEELKSLATHARELAKASKKENYAGHPELNQKFKFTIYKAADSPILLDLIERLWLQIGPFMSHHGKDSRLRQAKNDRHEAVYAALREGDGATARREIEQDIADGGAFLRKVAGFDN